MMKTKIARRRGGGAKDEPLLQSRDCAAAGSGRPDLTREAREYDRTTSVNVRGGTAPDGTPWVEIRAAQGEPAVWLKLDHLADDARDAKLRMRAAGLHLFKDTLNKALDQARRVASFPALPLIDHPGWSGSHFALPSGEVYSPSEGDDAIVLFEAEPHKCGAGGSLDAWLSEVARLATNQPLVTFAVMAAFTGPILRLSRVRENIGFELSGPKGVGKSTLQHLATSVCGPALEPAGANYWISANTTMNALEEQLPLHSDLLMVIEELSVMYAGESDKVRANRMQEFVFRMAAGTGKSRFQSGSQRPARFVWLTSTNDPVATLLGGKKSDATEAAADRLLGLPISPKRKNGIFQKDLPDGCETGEEAARAITELAADHYGHAIRKYLSELVKARHRSEDELRAEIESYIQELREAVGVDGNIGSEARVGDSFGVVYAAGRLAQRYGALPTELNCLDAALRCHRINRKNVGAQVSNVQRLHRLAKRKDVARVDPARDDDAYLEALRRAPALLLVRRPGKRELLVSGEALERFFPDQRLFMSDPAVRSIMRHDADHNNLRIRIRRGGKRERFYCFRLKSGADDGCAQVVDRSDRLEPKRGARRK